MAITNEFTYDFAPEPDIRMFKYGDGEINSEEVGISAYSDIAPDSDATGFVRSNGPSLIFD